MGDAVDRDLALFHALEQRRLCLRRGAVDLVADDDIREHGSLLELEAPLDLVVDRDARHVGGQKVRGELDAAHARVHRRGQRLREHRLADARHVLDQQVAAGEEHDDREVHLLVLAGDDRRHALADLPGAVLQRDGRARCASSSSSLCRRSPLSRHGPRCCGFRAVAVFHGHLRIQVPIIPRTPDKFGQPLSAVYDTPPLAATITA